MVCNAVLHRWFSYSAQVIPNTGLSKIMRWLFKTSRFRRLWAETTQCKNMQICKDSFIYERKKAWQLKAYCQLLRNHLLLAGADLGVCSLNNEIKEKFQHSSWHLLSPLLRLFDWFQAILELTHEGNLLHKNIHDSYNLLSKVSFTCIITGHTKCQMMVP